MEMANVETHNLSKCRELNAQPQKEPQYHTHTPKAQGPSQKRSRKTGRASGLGE